MRRWGFILFLCAVLTVAVVTIAMAGSDTAPVSRFTIHSAVIAGGGAVKDPPVTILLDRTTGQTWMLGVIENKPQWLSISYRPEVPKNALPPSFKGR